MVRNFALTFAAVTLRLYLPSAFVAGIAFESAYPGHRLAVLAAEPGRRRARLQPRAPRVGDTRLADRPGGADRPAPRTA
jgi:hypothetical protein